MDKMTLGIGILIVLISIFYPRSFKVCVFDTPENKTFCFDDVKQYNNFLTYKNNPYYKQYADTFYENYTGRTINITEYFGVINE